MRRTFAERFLPVEEAVVAVADPDGALGDDPGERDRMLSRANRALVEGNRLQAAHFLILAEEYDRARSLLDAVLHDGCDGELLLKIKKMYERTGRPLSSAALKKFADDRFSEGAIWEGRLACKLAGIKPSQKQLFRCARQLLLIPGFLGEALGVYSEIRKKPVPGDLLAAARERLSPGQIALCTDHQLVREAFELHGLIPNAFETAPELALLYVTCELVGLHEEARSVAARLTTFPPTSQLENLSLLAEGLLFKEWIELPVKEKLERLTRATGRYGEAGFSRKTAVH